MFEHFGLPGSEVHVDLPGYGRARRPSGDCEGCGEQQGRLLFIGPFDAMQQALTYCARHAIESKGEPRLAPAQSTLQLFESVAPTGTLAFAPIPHPIEVNVRVSRDQFCLEHAIARTEVNHAGKSVTNRVRWREDPERLPSVGLIFYLDICGRADAQRRIDPLDDEMRALRVG